MSGGAGSGAKPLGAPFRVAWIGCGGVVAAGHVPALTASGALAPTGGLEVCALADPTEAARARVGAALDVAPARRFAETGEMLAAVRPQAVVVALPTALHGAAVRAALAAGAEVLCEKPLAPRLAEAAGLAGEAARRGRRLAVVHNYLAARLWAAALALVAADELGPATALEVEVRAPGPLPGVWGRGGLWRLERRWAGRGCLLDQGYHFLYLARHLFGGGPLACEARLQRHGTYGGDLDDAAEVTLSYAGDRVCRLSLSWAAAGPPRSRHRIACTRGALVLDEEAGVVEVRPEGGQLRRIALAPGDDADGYRGGLVAELAAFAAGRAPAVPAEAGLAVLEDLERCYSAAAGPASGRSSGPVPALAPAPAARSK